MMVQSSIVSRKLECYSTDFRSFLALLEANQWFLNGSPKGSDHLSHELYDHLLYLLAAFVLLFLAPVTLDNAKF